MALVLKDRVVESSTSSGTGTFTLNGAETGYQSFSVIGNGNTTYYTIEHPQTGEWEVGVGTYNAGTLSRDTVLDSSNSGALVYFSSGQKNVFCDLPAEKVAPADSLGTMAYENSNNVSITGGSLTSVTLNNPTIGNYEAWTSTSAPSYVEGLQWYDSTAHSLAYYNDSANSIVHIGQDIQVKVINNTGSTIANGSPVYITSTSSGQTYPNIALAKADVVATSSVIGLTNGAIVNGAIGYVTSTGTIDNVNTSTFAVGQVLYLSPYSAGQLMNTVPPTGLSVQVGVVSYVNSSTGKIYVKQTTPLAISGVTIDNSPIGNTTASTGKFTSVTTPSVTATNTDLTLSAISTGAIKFQTLGGLQAQVSDITSAVNYFNINGSATTKATQIKTLGADTNISMAFQPKGTGAIDLAAGSSGVNISNGGTVTAITRTTQGLGYTTPPTWSASAPTTAGGVTSTGTTTLALSATPTITSGGTGYTVGDTLTLTGGTGTPATVTVSAVTGGVITTIATGLSGSYSVIPSNPISVTGGTGTGATFTANWGISSGGFTISQAGSGYIEQPTVTFSGGGGSGASAYATVGSGTQIKSLGTSLSFYTPNGETFRVLDGGALATNGYWAATYSSSLTQPVLRSYGSSTAYISNQANFGLSFLTGSTTSQMQITHTASAVNYVQVTGAATGNIPAISAQGSDASISMSYIAKGSNGFHFFYGNSAPQFAVVPLASTVNYLTAKGNIASNAPALSVAGTDTNINLALTPKGTGTVQFGTYTAGVLTPTGYITITDSGGTTRRLLVG